jgi:hypothetical protein
MPEAEPPQDAPTGQTLNGWKEIAAYLGKSVRSVQRWEEQLKLPVQRIQTPKGQIVYAESADIDRWRRELAPVDRESVAGPSAEAEQPQREPTSPFRPIVEGRSIWPFVAMAGLLLSMGGMAGFYWSDRDTEQARPVKLRIQDRSLQTLDVNGNALWSYGFDHDVSTIESVLPGAFPDEPLMVDLDGDGADEMLVAVRRAVAKTTPAISDVLYCFDLSGKLRWNFAPDQSLSFGGKSFAAPWVITRVAVSSQSPRRVWVSSHHHTWWPGFVTEIQSDGQARTIYVQSGRIYTLEDWNTPAGTVLAVGGVNHTPREAMVVLLQAGAAPASFSATDGPGFQCDNCGSNVPRKVLLFDQNELAVKVTRRHPLINTIQAIGPSLKVSIWEGGTDVSHGGSFVMLRPDLSVESVSFYDGHWVAHRNWEGQGVLDHPADQCPERTRPRRVRQWTPEGGWSDTHITPVSHTP